MILGSTGLLFFLLIIPHGVDPRPLASGLRQIWQAPGLSPLMVVRVVHPQEVSVVREVVACWLQFI